MKYILWGNGTISRTKFKMTLNSECKHSFTVGRMSYIEGLDFDLINKERFESLLKQPNTKEVWL